MPYPESPFSHDFNDEILIPPSCTLQNKEAFVIQLKQWLCRTPDVTTIRIDSNNKNTLDLTNLIKEQLNKIYEDRNIAPSKVYKHATLEAIVVEHLNVKELNLEKVEKEVIVDCKCAAAVLRGAHIFAPGVVGMTKDCHLGDRVSIYVDTNVNNKCKKGFAKVWHSSNKHFIANGLVKLTRNELFSAQSVSTGLAIEITDTISGCPRLDSTFLHNYDAMLQNLPSIVAVESLDVEKHSRILDMCASPGGKTMHIVSKMNALQDVNVGKFLMAVDKTPQKILQLKRTCDKYNVTNIRIECIDWVRPSNKMADVIDEVTRQQFDAILLDAPCSASGNRPQLLNSDSETILGSFVPVQKNLLRAAANMLKPGGVLVYSTCSVAAPENEGVVTHALKKLPLQLVPALPKHGGDGLPHEGLDNPHFVQRFGPRFDRRGENDTNNSIGFFIAKFRKIETDATFDQQ